MAGVRLDVTFDDQRVLRALKELSRRGGSAEPAMKAIGEDWQRSHRRRFDAQVSPEGQPWEPLDEAYRKRKKKHQNEILVLNTYLRDTLRYETGPDSLEFGTDRVYGATHQFGDDARGIPARPWLGLSEDDEAAAIKTLLAHLEEPLQ